MEYWKDILGYEGYYQVSNYGRVRSLDRIVNHWKGGKQHKKGCIMKLKKNRRNYYYVHLAKCGTKKISYIHQLVAKTFIPNPNNYPCVNHIDENPMNNNVENLEWCTFSYNNNYGTKIERQRKTLLKTIQSKKKK